MPNLLFVYDARDNPNWGGRVTSLAVGQHLERFGSVTSLNDAWATRPVPTGPFAGWVRQLRLGDMALPLGDIALLKLLSLRSMQAALAGFGYRRDFVGLDAQAAVTRFLRACRNDTSLRSLQKLFERSDAVIINGMGALIFRSPPRRDLNFLMFVIELAHALGKPTFFINAMASDCPHSGTNAAVEMSVKQSLNKANAVVTRDHCSKQRLEKLGVNNVTMVPDAAYMWAFEYPEMFSGEFRLTRPELLDVWPEDRARFRSERMPSEYLAVLGASRHPGEDVKHWPAFFDRIATRLTDELGLPIIFVDSGGDGFLEGVAERTESHFIRPHLNVLWAAHIMANAVGVVGGRFHPGIFAALGGASCTFLDCASHKTFSVQEQLAYPSPKVFSIDGTRANIEAIVANVAADVDAGDSSRARLSGTAHRLANEARLGLESVFEEAARG